MFRLKYHEIIIVHPNVLANQILSSNDEVRRFKDLRGSNPQTLITLSYYQLSRMLSETPCTCHMCLIKQKLIVRMDCLILGETQRILAIFLLLPKKIIRTNVCVNN